jgi:hypothetical protein
MFLQTEKFQFLTHVNDSFDIIQCVYAKACLLVQAYATYLSKGLKTFSEKTTGSHTVADVPLEMTVPYRGRFEN